MAVAPVDDVASIIVAVRPRRCLCLRNLPRTRTMCVLVCVEPQVVGVCCPPQGHSRHACQIYATHLHLSSCPRRSCSLPRIGCRMWKQSSIQASKQPSSLRLRWSDKP